MARIVTATVKSPEKGEALVTSYPIKKQKYKIPLYEMVLSGSDASGAPQSYTYKVIRFGVSLNTSGGTARVVGLRDSQTHVLKHVSYMGGSWQLYGNFLIHDGADDPSKNAWGAIGCIEVTGTSAAYGDAWQEFNANVLALSGESSFEAVSAAKCFSITLDRIASYPPLVKA